MENIGPPQPTAISCEPPFPRNFAQTYFWLADLDEGVSCRGFIEQDECILGIYQDCTTNNVYHREWQGIASTKAGNEHQINLVAHQSSTHSARPPSCCVGSLNNPRPDEATWAHLACRERDCENEHDNTHIGFYLEKDQPSVAKIGTRSTAIQMPGSVADFVVLNTGDIWSLIEGGSTGLFVGVDLQIPLSQPKAIAVSPAQDFVVIQDGDSLLRVSTSSKQQEGPTVDMGEILHFAVLSSGVLVATTTTSIPDSFTTVKLLSADLTEIDRRNVDERVSFVAPIEGHATEIAALTSSDEALIITLDAVLNPTIFELSSPLTLKWVSVPVHPISIGSDTIGFVGQCFANPTKQRCYYELDIEDGNVRRIGLPDVEVLSAPVWDGDRAIYLASTNGWFSMVDRVDWRSPLQSRVADLPRAHRRARFANQRTYVLSEDQRVIHPIDH